MRLHPLFATVVVGATVLLGCGDDGETVVDPSGSGGQGGQGGAPLTLPSCAATEAARPDGSCVRVGVEVCARGFASDDDGGCDPVVPAGPCAAGSMKVLGETDCVDMAPCQGKWGRAPVGPNTEFVDASYTGNDSDGSEQKPWTSIAAGISAAQSGAVVAVAAGSYGTVVDASKPIALWGACPTTVVVDTSDVVGVFVGAAGVEVHDLSVTNSNFGIVSIAANTLIEGVWVHDTWLYGIFFDGDTRVNVGGTIRRSAITHAAAIGIAGFNADLVVEDVHVFEPLPDAGGESGRGIRCRPSDGPKSISIDGAVVERAYSAGVQLAGVTANVTRLYVDDTQGRAVDGLNGVGLDVVSHLDVMSDTTYYADVTVDGAVVARSHGSALHSEDSTTVVSNTVLRDVVPNQSSITTGNTVTALGWSADNSLTLRSSLLERSVSSGLFMASRGAAKGGVGQSEALLERVWIRSIAPKASGELGFGVFGQGAVDGAARSVLIVRDSLVDGVSAGGVVALDTDLTLSGSEIRDVDADGFGDFGDGISVIRYFQPESVPQIASVTQVLIRNSARAGIGSFGAAVDIDSLWIECSAFPLNGEVSVNGVPYDFNVSGDNRCACGEVSETCRTLTSGLNAPDPL